MILLRFPKTDRSSRRIFDGPQITLSSCCKRPGAQTAGSAVSQDRVFDGRSRGGHRRTPRTVTARVASGLADACGGRTDGSASAVVTAPIDSSEKDARSATPRPSWADDNLGRLRRRRTGAGSVRGGAAAGRAVVPGDRDAIRCTTQRAVTPTRPSDTAPDLPFGARRALAHPSRTRAQNAPPLTVNDARFLDDSRWRKPWPGQPDPAQTGNAGLSRTFSALDRALRVRTWPRE